MLVHFQNRLRNIDGFLSLKFSLFITRNHALGEQMLTMVLFDRRVEVQIFHSTYNGCLFALVAVVAPIITHYELSPAWL